MKSNFTIFFTSVVITIILLSIDSQVMPSHAPLKKRQASLEEDIDPDVFIDEILETARQIIKAEELDPIEIEKQTILDIDTQGWIGGYSSIHRHGHAHIEEFDDIMSISANLQVSKLKGDFSWKAKWDSNQCHGSANATVSSFDFNITLVVNFSIPEHVRATVKQLVLHDIGDIRTAVSGFGIFDDLIDAIADVIIYIIKQFIPVLFDNVIKQKLQEAIDYFLKSHTSI